MIYACVEGESRSLLNNSKIFHFVHMIFWSIEYYNKDSGKDKCRNRIGRIYACVEAKVDLK